MLGTARYATRCSALFHMKRRDPLVAGDAEVVAQRVRQPGGRRPTSAYVVRRAPSPVQVTTSDVPCTVLPCVRIRDTCSGGPSSCYA